MFKFNPLALILRRCKDDDTATIEVSLGSDRRNGAAETILVPLTPKWSGVKANCGDVLRLIVAATGFEPAHLAMTRNSNMMHLEEEISASKGGSYRVVRVEGRVNMKKTPFFHCAVVALQASSNLFLCANASATGLSVSRFNVDHSCVFALFGSPSDGCIVQSYSTGRYIQLTRQRDHSVPDVYR
jgi:hypothetical protein